MTIGKKNRSRLIMSAKGGGECSWHRFTSLTVSPWAAVTVPMSTSFETLPKQTMTVKLVDIWFNEVVFYMRTTQQQAGCWHHVHSSKTSRLFYLFAAQFATCQGSICKYVVRSAYDYVVIKKIKSISQRILQMLNPIVLLSIRLAPTSVF